MEIRRSRCGCDHALEEDGRHALDPANESDEKFVEDEQVALLFDEGKDGVNIVEWKKAMETEKELQKVWCTEVVETVGVFLVIAEDQEKDISKELMTKKEKMNGNDGENEVKDGV
ncbi:hypothetical protein NDU88_006772 [Pleurodeles waltl]|uniref:Uncharacterized protein n=1 Tax=Pleurodeles waltl TaxID=8319 RepID=A0AAV7QPY7_PLEWA|nr:hypothetical protein NDU88_006772 [Pleurodeles waltl]